MSTALVPVDPSSAVAVTSYLEQAKTWLATAVEQTGPEQIARAKAEIATAAEATRQLHLSKDIQHDAEEMVRRAEWALGKSIRQGQADGTIASQGAAPDFSQGEVRRVTDFGTVGELYGRDGKAGILDLADDLPERTDLEAALDLAKSENNLSRSNVGRKALEVTGSSKSVRNSKVITRDMRAEMIQALADQGYSSRQMPAKVGVTEESVRKIARDFDIEIPADRSISKTRRVDSNRIVANTVTALEGLVMGTDLVDFDALDAREVSQWADSLTHSLRALNKFAKQIKETTHD